MKSIHDIIKNLSSEEKELHKELIQECIEREEMINNSKWLLELVQIHDSNFFSD